jgi:hypothetical protein
MSYDENYRFPETPATIAAYLGARAVLFCMHDKPHQKTKGICSHFLPTNIPTFLFPTFPHFFFLTKYLFQVTLFSS